MDKRDTTDEELKYARPGHVNLDRVCDKLVLHAIQRLPGTGVLPQYWRWTSVEAFNEHYGDLGAVVWAKTSSYHLLLVRGQHAFRIWTDSPGTALVDVSESLAKDLQGTFKVMDVPVSTRRKTKPLTKRIRLNSTRDVDILLLQTLWTFGII